MDPLSIVGAVASVSKTVYSASTTLYTFVSETRNVDQTVIDLATEVDALNSALKEVEAVLKSPTIIDAEKRGSAEDNKQLWQTIYGALDECQITVVRIDSALDGVRKKRSNWATQTFRQMKLNLGKDEIDSLRAQTHTHYSALKMALAMVTIRAAYNAPVVVIADLGPRIENLQGSLDLLTTSLEGQRREIALMSGKLTNADSANTERLRLLARHILSKATTVHGSTVAGGSICGDPAADEIRARTMNWIPAPVVNERASSRSSVTQSRDQTLFSEPDGTVDTDLTEGTVPHNEPELADSDSDGEFELEVTRRLLDKGKKLFDLDNYAEAVRFLQNSVASFNRLPNSQRTQLDLAEVPIMIATCKYHLKELNQAEGDLLLLVRQESTSDRDAIRTCQISHLLSQIYLIKNQLEASEDYCRKSLKGRRRLLGKEHQDYFASLRLLSDICNVRGKDEEASVYQDMIPPEIAQLQKKIRPEQNCPNDAALITNNPPETAQLQKKMRPEDYHPKDTAFFANNPEMNQEILQRPRSTLRGHTGRVYSVTFSPDAKLVLTGSRDMTARLWDVATSMKRVTFEGHTHGVRDVAFSPDGKLVVTGSEDHIAKLWDATTGAKRVTLKGHTRGVLGVAFSPDGKLVATGSGDKTTRLWDTATGASQLILKGHTVGVNCVVFSPDGKLIATGSGDGTVRLWDTVTGTRQIYTREPYRWSGMYCFLAGRQARGNRIRGQNSQNLGHNK
ncbi:hypothetical protein EPUS_01093 [Endocarpon pusillum Z07020]|uniref:Azaphilone pigments biosynthesis cluster protein L N-terminal domain-containing protein n=1 Tax=Endocarpon pusillum (strain Z07020 / HMAS-L-300199) TaxID=1263415 RepID=U1FWC8_ENDPU|nr:uncharacterized protein EPUS_01093 [Endocarpon pusillum Z07020]ERF69137.1 hypothetical protein EPUS_01093 [Endocarpon pusillum Z07020]